VEETEARSQGIEDGDGFSYVGVVPVAPGFPESMGVTGILVRDVGLGQDDRMMGVPPYLQLHVDQPDNLPE